MLPDPPQLASPAPPEPVKEPVRSKCRIRFRKGGDLRLLSHHDLVTCFERMLRRANLPFHSTQGFHPKPRLVFPLSLALGIIGADEVVELELDAELSPAEIHARLARQAPPGLTIHSVQRIDRRTRGQAASVTYRVAVPPERTLELPERIASVLAAPACWIERTRPEKRRINLRPYLRDVRLVDEALAIDLWVTPNGTARPEEILNLLTLDDLLTAGAVVERTRLELLDEMEGIEGRVPLPDRIEPQGQRPTAEAIQPDTEDGAEKPCAGGASPVAHGRPLTRSLIPGPLSFEN
jgi:radical SAM-linked protein